MKRILSIDGGGIKGILPAAFLAEVENATGERIVDHFDLIAGTSTGGIIAIGLGLGLSAGEILDLYRRDGPTIFGQASGLRGLAKSWFRRARQLVHAKHNADDLRDSLTKVLGDRLLGESATRLLIPAYHPDLQTVYCFKTAHHRRFERDYKVPAVDVALATAAAPTFFQAHRLASGASLIDGGIWANNPVGHAAVEAVGVLGWKSDDLRILSLGCGEEVFDVPPAAGFGRLGLKTIDLLFKGQASGSLGTAKILSGYDAAEPRLFRHSPAVERGVFKMDDAKLLERLAGMGGGEARNAIPVMRKVFLVGEREPFTPYHPNDDSLAR